MKAQGCMEQKGLPPDLNKCSESNAFLGVLRSRQHFLTAVCILFVWACLALKQGGSITYSCLIFQEAGNFSLISLSTT